MPSQQAPTPSTAGKVEGYRALTSSSATKTETPLQDVPQSIQVIPRSLIEDQAPIGMDEALQNVSAVQGTIRIQTPAYDNTLVRGFATDQWLDGMPVFYNPGARDGLINIERIEVLKGPNAVLYGGGGGTPPGGAINIVSKLPDSDPRVLTGLTIGSDAYVRGFTDLNQPLTSNGSVLFRVTGEYGDADSFVDVIETQDYAFNPTLTLDNKQGTRLTLQGRATKWAGPEYQGLPATGTVAGSFRIDPDLFIGPSNVPDSTSELQSVTATLD